MNGIEYCREWFRYEKCALEPFDEARARRAHKNRDLYTAVLMKDGRPYCFVEVKGGYFGVEFLDEHLRNYYCLQFQERRPGMLFNNMAACRSYIGDSFTLKDGVSLAFEEDGSVLITRESFIDKTMETSEAVANLAGSWERYPDFGHYEAITRMNRPGTYPLGPDAIKTRD